MKNNLKQIGLFLSIAVSVLFILFVINQTAQAVQLASAVSPLLGQIVLYGLLAVYLALALVPAALYLRLPPALRPPEDIESKEFAAYLIRLADRLRGNPHLAGCDLSLSDRDGIEAAISILDDRARAIIKSSASTVFVSTAISQSGRLDTLMVLAALSRMVWSIAHVYYSRPSLREMLTLYANVAGTAFLVREIEDLDIAEQVEPIIASAISGSIVGAVPGVGIAATMMTTSILEGTANAFLTLRVGVIAGRYCSATTRPERRGLRRFAAAEAAGLLGVIVLDSAAVVSRTIAHAARKAGVDTVGNVFSGVSRMPRHVAGRLARRPRAGDIPPPDAEGIE